MIVISTGILQAGFRSVWIKDIRQGAGGVCSGIGIAKEQCRTHHSLPAYQGGTAKAAIWNERGRLTTDTPTETVTWQRKVMLGPIDIKQRCAHTASLVGFRLFLIGGITAGGFCSDVSIIHLGKALLGNETEVPDTMTLSVPEQRGDIPPPRANHTAVVFGRKIYIFGGVGESGKYLNDVYSFDTGT